jgi:hypothetical protein
MPGYDDIANRFGFRTHKCSFVLTNQNEIYRPAWPLSRKAAKAQC